MSHKLLCVVSFEACMSSYWFEMNWVECSSSSNLLGTFVKSLIPVSTLEILWDRALIVDLTSSML